jgi:transposase
MRKVLTQQSQEGQTNLQFDAKRIAEHYEVSVDTVYRIIRRGNESETTNSSKRPGRTKLMSPNKVGPQDFRREEARN